MNMNITQSIKSPSFLREGLFAILLLSIVMLFPSIASATSETGTEVTKSILENIVKYSRWIAFGVIGIAFITVGWFSLRAYGAWADEDNKAGTMPRLILTIFLGILVIAVVTIFVTKGVKYLEKNLKPTAGTSTTLISPVNETTIV